MRKLNGILTAMILVLFILHGIPGAFQLFGSGNSPVKWLAYLLVALVAVHALIGIKFTLDSLRVWKKIKRGYLRQNALFWARRISGFAVMLMMGFHVTAFGDYSKDTYRLKWFTDAKLIAQLLLVAALMVHIITNVKPMLITFGIRSLKEYAADILIVLSVVLLFMAIAFVVYYLRWNGY